MSTESTPGKPVRGRPPTITPQRIADAGIRMGLPNISMAAMARALGVTQMALYKRAANLQAVKQLVAAEIFLRWPLPRAGADGDAAEALDAYLMRFVDALCRMVRTHPGLPPYLLRRSAATTAMLDKISEHQAHVAAVHGLPLDRARWLLATLAFHCIAGADTVFLLADDGDATEAPQRAENAEVIAEFMQGMHALVIGSLQLLRSDSSD